MNLIALELPENVNDWPNWLERHVVGMHLRDLVGQLEVIAAERKPQAVTPPGDNWDQRLRSLLGVQYPDVLKAGLSVLHESQLRELVRHPCLLLALQECVLTEGGNYWRQVPRSDEHLQAASQIATRVTAAITNGPIIAKPPETSRSNRRLFVAVSALAASVLFGLFLWRGNEPEGKFFARRGLLQSDQQGQAFLQELASAVSSDWQTPTNTEAAFRQKLTTLRDSCDVLLAADLPQLPPAVADELKSKCKKWRDAFTKSIADLEAGSPLDNVQTDVETTVSRLISVIRDLA